MENSQLIWWFPAEPMVFWTATFPARTRIGMRTLIGAPSAEACFLQLFMTTPDRVLDLRRRTLETPNLGGPFMPEMDEFSLRSAVTFRTAEDLEEDAQDATTTAEGDGNSVVALTSV